LRRLRLPRRFGRSRIRRRSRVGLCACVSRRSRIGFGSRIRLRACIGLGACAVGIGLGAALIAHALITRVLLCRRIAARLRVFTRRVRRRCVLFTLLGVAARTGFLALLRGGGRAACIVLATVRKRRRVQPLSILRRVAAIGLLAAALLRHVACLSRLGITRLRGFAIGAPLLRIGRAFGAWNHSVVRKTGRTLVLRIRMFRRPVHLRRTAR